MLQEFNYWVKYKDIHFVWESRVIIFYLLKDNIFLLKSQFQNITKK